MQRALSTEHEALTSTHKKRHVAYRVTVVSLNDQKQTIYKETSGNNLVYFKRLMSIFNPFVGIKQATLGKNDSSLMLEMDPVMTVFPLLLSFNFCVSTPLISPSLGEGELELNAGPEVLE